MFHHFTGELQNIDWQVFLINQYFGIEVVYDGQMRQGSFFLYPYMDEQNKTIRYFAFDTNAQKKLFLTFYKIQWIGPTTAFKLSHIEQDSIQNAIEHFDTKVFTAIPGVGPKTAKRLLVELKTKLKKQDISKLNLDPKLMEHIIQPLRTMGYEKSAITKKLSAYPWEVSKEATQNIIVRLIQHL